MIEVFIHKEKWSSSLSVWIIDRDIITGKRYVLQFGKNNNSMIEIKEYSEKPEPSFKLVEGQANEFLKAMADCAASWGIKTDPDLKREGKLEAVEKHLEDMRKLVFKDKENEI